MMRYAAAFLAGLFAIGTTGAAEAKKVTIRWHGQSYFEIISSKGTRIVTDPHLLEAYGQINTSADIVTMSHNHNDHTILDVIENRNKAKILHGWKGADKKVNWNIIDEKIADVHIRTVGVYHDTMKGLERGINTVFIFEVDGLRIVHLGDLGHLLSEGQVKEIGPVDVLMIPVGGVYTINGSEAQKVVEQLKPRMYIIPMHYGTKVFDDVLPADEFLEDQKKENIKVFPHTNELVVSTDFKPAEPIIAVLNWRKETRSQEK